MQAATTQVSKVVLAKFSAPVTLAGAVPRTLSGTEAGRAVGFGCLRGCTGG